MEFPLIYGIVPDPHLSRIVLGLHTWRQKISGVRAWRALIGQFPVLRRSPGRHSE